MPRSTKTIGARMKKPDAKLVEAAAESAGESVSSWAGKKLRSAALEELSDRFSAQSTAAGSETGEPAAVSQ